MPPFTRSTTLRRQGRLGLIVTGAIALITACTTSGDGATPQQRGAQALPGYPPGWYPPYWPPVGQQGTGAQAAMPPYPYPYPPYPPYPYPQYPNPGSATGRPTDLGATLPETKKDGAELQTNRGQPDTNRGLPAPQNDLGSDDIVDLAPGAGPTSRDGSGKSPEPDRLELAELTPKSKAPDTGSREAAVRRQPVEVKRLYLGSREGEDAIALLRPSGFDMFRNKTAELTTEGDATMDEFARSLRTQPSSSSVILVGARDKSEDPPISAKRSQRVRQELLALGVEQKIKVAGPTFQKALETQLIPTRGIRPRRVDVLIGPSEEQIRAALSGNDEGPVQPMIMTRKVLPSLQPVGQSPLPPSLTGLLKQGGN